MSPIMSSIAGTIGDMVKKGVPGVPLHALDAIQDENVRTVLQALVDGWHVRNGNSGDGDGAFVTRSEIDGLVSTKTTSAVRSLGALTLSPGEISRALNDLHTQVFNSRLFRALETRIDLIDKPGGLSERMDRIFTRVGDVETSIINETKQRQDGDFYITTQFTALGKRVGDSETAISTEIQQRVSANTAFTSRLDAMDTRVGSAETSLTRFVQQSVDRDNALQRTIDTQYAAVGQSLALFQQSITTNSNAVSAVANQYSQIQASIGNLSAAIRQESDVRAAADGTLAAQYTLKLDVGGYVAGFGLANTGKTSDFIVRSDTFSIVSPSGDVAALIVRNNTIHVFDQNGAIRVRIGQLA